MGEISHACRFEAAGHLSTSSFSGVRDELGRFFRLLEEKVMLVLRGLRWQCLHASFGDLLPARTLTHDSDNLDLTRRKRPIRVLLYTNV